MVHPFICHSVTYKIWPKHRMTVSVFTF
jgi:hypothetical protein